MQKETIKKLCGQAYIFALIGQILVLTPED